MNLRPRGRRSGGFTLIELMVTVGIVAILVALAVPAYNDYTIRSKVAECISNAAVAKVQVSEFRQTMGSWPPTIEQAGLDVSGFSRYCDGYSNYSSATGGFMINIDEPTIDTIIVGELTPVLTPAITVSNNVNWYCSNGVTSPSNLKYLPATCRSNSP